MKLISKLFAIVFLICIISGNIFPQQKQSFVLRLDFVPMLDSLIIPPANCETAYLYKVSDSVSGESLYMEILVKQENHIEEIYNELSAHLIKDKKIKSDMQQRPGVISPPGGMPPGPPPGMNDEMKEAMEEINDADITEDKLTVEKEKFKNKLTEMQDEINSNLHKTTEADYDSRIFIINDFLKSGLILYDKYKRSFRENMLTLDEIVKKYDYGSKIKFPPLKSDIYGIQMLQVTILKFLINVTKEFINIGAKFYEEKYKDMNH